MTVLRTLTTLAGKDEDGNLVWIHFSKDEYEAGGIVYSFNYYTFAGDSITDRVLWTKSKYKVFNTADEGRELYKKYRAEGFEIIAPKHTFTPTEMDMR